MSTGGLSSSDMTSRRPRSRPDYWPVRLRILRRLGVLFLVGLLLATFGVGVYRAVRMFGLPDVGDPFGPPAPPQRTSTVGPNHVDTLYQQAIGTLKPLNTISDRGVTKLNLLLTWAQANPALRQWVQDNDSTSEFFRQAAELPGASGEPGPASGSGPLSKEGSPFHELVWLALLNGSRQAEAKDMAAAWRWYRAALVSTYAWRHDHEAYGRFFAQEARGSIAILINAWAEDPAVTPAMLRQALDEVIPLQKRIPTDVSTLQAGYHRLILEIDNGIWSTLQDTAPWTAGVAGYELPMNLKGTLWACRRFLDDEPERSRRVIRLAFANWQARFALPAQLRPKPSIKASAQRRQSTSSVVFFMAGPNAPESARRMSPRRLAAWFETTDDARFPLAEFWWMFQSTRIREQAGHAALLVHLAEQLYLREHGKLPPNPEALVGPYLKSLPDDGSSELDDGTIPSLHDS